MKKKLIWCIQHNPVELLLRVAKDFSQILARYTDDYQIEVLTQQEYADYYNNGKLEDTLDLVHDNKVQISQTFAWKLSYLNSNFEALDMPYLFKDHAHAERVLDGSIGRSLLNSLKKNKKELHGLAFTYSGGYRMFCSDTPIKSLDDLQGREVMVSTSPLSLATVNALGAKGKSENVWDNRRNWFEGKPGLITETTWVRYDDWLKDFAPYVLDARHSLFLTTLIANRQFWESLSDEHKGFFSEAANEAAANEKKFTVIESARLKQQMQANGTNLVVLDDKDIGRAKEMVLPVINKWKDAYLPDLIDTIRAA